MIWRDKHIYCKSVGDERKKKVRETGTTKCSRESVWTGILDPYLNAHCLIISAFLFDFDLSWKHLECFQINENTPSFSIHQFSIEHCKCKLIWHRSKWSIHLADINIRLISKKALIFIKHLIYTVYTAARVSGLPDI